MDSKTKKYLIILACGLGLIILSPFIDPKIKSLHTKQPVAKLWLPLLKPLLLMDFYSFSCPEDSVAIDNLGVSNADFEKTCKHADGNISVIGGNKDGFIVTVMHAQSLPSVPCTKESLKKVFKLDTDKVFDAQDLSTVLYAKPEGPFKVDAAQGELTLSQFCSTKSNLYTEVLLITKFKKN